MTALSEARPQFFEGQYLSAADLTAAVAYARTWDERHMLGAHVWGIAAGVQLQEVPHANDAGVDVFIRPGYAWDGFGRAIVVLTPYQVPASLFQNMAFDPAQPNGYTVPVWICYSETAGQGPQPGFQVCDAADQSSRVIESFQVVVGTQQSLSPIHDPISVAGMMVQAEQAYIATDPPNAPVPSLQLKDASVAFQDFPGDGALSRWLIPLGQVHWTPSNVAGQAGMLSQSSQDEATASRGLRRYIGVVAQSVLAADGALCLADRLLDFTKAPNLASNLVFVKGSLLAEGDLRLKGTQLDFRSSDGTSKTFPLSFIRSEVAGGAALDLALGNDPASTTTRFGIGPLDTTKTPPSVIENIVALANGNVGIANPAPPHALQIGPDAGGIGVDKSSGSPDAGFIRFGDNTGWKIHVARSRESGLGPINTGTTGALLTIQDNGNVGINTTTPSLPLEINGNFGSPNAPSTLSLWGSRIGDIGGGILFLRSGGGVVAFDGNDNVGIGTTTPSLPLEINGDFGSPHQKSIMHLLGSKVGDLGDGRLFLRSGGGVVTFDGNDNVGIGTVNPGIPLEVSGDFGCPGGPAQMHLWGSQIGDVGFGKLFLRSGGGVVTFDGGDSVGIGTTTPATLLDVAGDITVQGTRTYLIGADGASEHWIMAGGTVEGTNNAIGFNLAAKQFHTGPGWTKGFMIRHPLTPEAGYLVHSTLEGPEAAVFYRGEAQLAQGRAVVHLPSYFEALTRQEGRTVMLTPKLHEGRPACMLAASDVRDGRFTVEAIGDQSPSQRFFWEVKAVRADVSPFVAEPARPAAGPGMPGATATAQAVPPAAPQPVPQEASQSGPARERPAPRRPDKDKPRRKIT